MRAIESLAEQIRNNQFDPDSTRSGRWMGSHTVPDVQPHPSLNEVASDDGSLSSSSDTDSESESEPQVDDRLVPEARVAVHVRTGVTHLLQDDEVVFACGRKRSLNYEEGSLASSEGVRLCIGCFK
eukprot:2898722-Amphidinium_carterae.1